MPKVDSINFVHSGRNVRFKGNETFSNFKSSLKTPAQATSAQTAPVASNVSLHPYSKSYAKGIIDIIPDSYADDVVGAGFLVGAAIFSFRNISKMKATIQKLITKNSSLETTVDNITSNLSKYVQIPEGLNSEKAGQAILEVFNGQYITGENMSATISQRLKQAIGDLTTSFNGAIDKLRSKSTAPVIINGIAPNPASIDYKMIHGIKVNGTELALADLISPIKYLSDGFNKMNTEFHQQSALSLLGLRKPQIPVKDPFVRIVSVELKPFTSVGGLATVPKELAEELPKIANSKSGARFMLDTPMYQGVISPESTARLITQPDGSYIYRITTPKGTQNYKVDLIDQIEVPIVGEKSQHVRIFQCDTTKQTDPGAIKALGALKKPFADIRELFSASQLQQIDKALEKGTKYEANGYLIFKNETGQAIFQPKIKYNLWENEKFDLDVPITAEMKNNYSDVAQNSGELDRFVFFAKYIYEQTIGMLQNREGGRIYNGKNAIFGADAFVLNDWHTGPLAALFRLGTVAKKYQQSLSEDVARKATNMPIISLLHNTYDKKCWDNNLISRLFNIMFGRNAVKVVPEAFMPDIAVAGKSGLSQDLWNGLMQEKAISPLKMLLTYSDSVHPVSVGYGEECKRFESLGHDLLQLYRLRAKEGFSASEMRDIIQKNGLSEYVGNISDKDIMRSTFYGITNGSNKANNILTQGKIDSILQDFYEPLKKVNPNLKRPNLIPYSKDLETDPVKAYEWKRHNKGELLELFKFDIDRARKSGVMKWPGSMSQEERAWGEIHPWLCKVTNLEGVTVDTPIFVSSGRITQQKGYETYMKGILDYIYGLGDDITKKEIPVFMIQGPIGYDPYAQSVVDCVNNTKNILFKEAEKHTGEKAAAFRKAAERIVLLDEGRGGRYEVTKVLTDVNVMASNYEPCGLTHKQFGNASGGIVVGNNTGGIPSGLSSPGTKCYIGVDFNPDHGLPIEADRPHPDKDFSIRGRNFAQGIFEATRRWYDQITGKNHEFADGVAEILAKDYTWARPGGPGHEYISALKNAGAI